MSNQNDYEDYGPPERPLPPDFYYGIMKKDCQTKKCIRDYAESCDRPKPAPNCQKDVQKVLEKLCKDKGDSPACDFLPTTTSTNKLPFIIGGVAGIIVLLAIGIGLFFYCRRKSKKNGQKKTMEGSGEGSVTNGTGVTPTASTPTGPTDPTGEGAMDRN